MWADVKGKRVLEREKGSGKGKGKRILRRG